jgi:quercetin dioxygenase-like cupin family protein
MNAIKLVTGPDNSSHILRGTLTLDQRTKVAATRFKESPPGSSFDWHEAPERQHVVTILRTLEFTTRDGETFVIRPGEVLVASDAIGSGHKWRLIDAEPWRRCYVILDPQAPDLFAPKP